MEERVAKITNGYGAHRVIPATDVPENWAEGKLNGLDIVLLGRKKRSGEKWWRDFHQFLDSQTFFGDWNHGSNVYEISEEIPAWNWSGPVGRFIPKPRENRHPERWQK